MNSTVFVLFISAAFFFSSCKQTDRAQLSGTYKLVSLQAQDDTIFRPMEGVEILKFFSGDQWISPAYLKRNNKVVNLAGGTFSFDGKTITETLLYHSKDTISIGTTSNYTIKLMGDTLYQSGLYKANTPDQWKVEEYWIKVK